MVNEKWILFRIEHTHVQGVANRIKYKPNRMEVELLGEIALRGFETLIFVHATLHDLLASAKQLREVCLEVGFSLTERHKSWNFRVSLC